MKKKITCDLKDLENQIMKILREPVSEGEAGGDPIEVKELRRILEGDFEFENQEFCEALSNLSFNLEVRFVFKGLIEDNSPGTEYYCAIDKILLGPGLKKDV